MLTVVPSHHHERIDVLPGGPNEFTFDVPEACLVKVRVIDDGTSSPVPVGRLSWHTPFPSEVRIYPVQGVNFRGGLAQLHAPVGEVSLDPKIGVEYALVPGQTWSVKPGTDELTIHVKRASGLRVRELHDGGQKPVLPFGALSLRAIGHSGRQGRQGRQGRLGKNTSLWCHDTQPGRYVLSINQVPGYEAIPDRTIDIPRSKILNVEVALVPKSS